MIPHRTISGRCPPTGAAGTRDVCSPTVHTPARWRHKPHYKPTKYNNNVTRNERQPRSPSAHSAQQVSTSLATKLQALGANPQLVLEHPELRSVDSELLDASLQTLSDWVPRRSLGALLERHPPILTAPVAAWADFLASFGFQRLAIQELFLNSPDVVTNSSVFRAGQVFLFLRQLGVPNDEIVGPIFRWRALLSEEVDYPAATSFLVEEAGVPLELMPRLATTYPSLLAAPVGAELRPRLDFLRALGPEAPPLLRGTLWEEWCGWLHGVANWSTAVAPKLAALERAVGGQREAEALLRAVPEALKYPPESRLAPNLRLLTGPMGLQGEALAALLRGAPAILSLAPEQLESRWTFLLEAANGSEADLLSYPPYLTASLAKVTGPRLFYAAQRDLMTRFNTPPQPASEGGPQGDGVVAGGQAGGGPGAAEDGLATAAGDLDLRWLCEGDDEQWLRRVMAEQRRRGGGGRGGGGSGKKGGGGVIGGGVTAAQGQGDTAGWEGEGEGEGEDEAYHEALLLLRGDYEELASEWGTLLGWCCDRAFTASGRKRFEEQLSLFYLLVQG